jgi:AcrR family transcriptional regulator
MNKKKQLVDRNSLDGIGRQLLIDLAIQTLAESSPSRLNSAELCAQLGVTKSLVNFHFGNKDGLLAEAIATAYEDLVSQLTAVASRTNLTPFSRLLVFVDTQFEWTLRFRGIAAQILFPEEWLLSKKRSSAQSQRIAQANIQYQRLLRDVVGSAALYLNPDRPGAELAPIESALVQWLTFGFSAWAAGNRIAVESVGMREFISEARARFHRVIEMILRSDE